MYLLNLIQYIQYLKVLMYNALLALFCQQICLLLFSC